MNDKQINAAIADHLKITRGVPDFTGDLNEIHEIEKQLNYRQFETYIFELCEVQHEPMLTTARQRAEALLVALEIKNETRR